MSHFYVSTRKVRFKAPQVDTPWHVTKYIHTGNRYDSVLPAWLLLFLNGVRCHRGSRDSSAESKTSQKRNGVVKGRKESNGESGIELGEGFVSVRWRPIVSISQTHTRNTAHARACADFAFHSRCFYASHRLSFSPSAVPPSASFYTIHGVSFLFFTRHARQSRASFFLSLSLYRFPFFRVASADAIFPAAFTMQIEPFTVYIFPFFLPFLFFLFLVLFLCSVLLSSFIYSFIRGSYSFGRSRRPFLWFLWFFTRPFLFSFFFKKGNRSSFHVNTMKRILDLTNSHGYRFA